MAIKWSRRARIDILDLQEYIRKDSPVNARRFTARMIAAIENLEHFPKMGRLVPEADARDDVRELIYQGYRIIYQTRKSELFIVTVIHGSRNLQGQRKKPWEQQRDRHNARRTTDPSGCCLGWQPACAPGPSSWPVAGLARDEYTVTGTFPERDTATLGGSQHQPRATPRRMLAQLRLTKPRAPSCKTPAGYHAPAW